MHRARVETPGRMEGQRATMRLPLFVRFKGEGVCAMAGRVGVDGGKLVHCTVGYRRLTAFRNAATSGQPVLLTFRMNASFPVTGFDWA